MDIQTALSVGNIYQNIAFYSFLVLLASLCIELLRYDAKRKKLRPNPHHD